MTWLVALMVMLAGNADWRGSDGQALFPTTGDANVMVADGGGGFPPPRP